MIPSNIIACILRMKTQDMFAIKDDEKENIKVEL